jgi:hypothetical protein
MRDKVIRLALPQAVGVSSSPVIRAMANTLLDSRTDLLDTTAIITRLISAGWLAREVEQYYSDAVLMAMTRKTNEKRATSEGIFL